MFKTIAWSVVVGFVAYLLFIAGKEILDTRIRQKIEDSYFLKDIGHPQIAFDGKSDNMSKIYRVKDSSVQQITEQLAGWVEPEATGEASDSRVLLLYPKDLVWVHADPQAPGVVWIEVSGKQFVRNAVRGEPLESHGVRAEIEHRWGPLNDLSRYEGFIDSKGRYAPVVQPEHLVLFESSGYVPDRGGGPDEGK
ncbi:DUF4247 domain-containing protein [Paenibacillus flagellatus]|uniref:DUF4247 domain-containing protein n=1 Tax=Paenibacillus flagellatus TaxID=2211139 RepID=UPI0013050DC6|nr:DUF4247 domain-containing protein [Paenibacillus flagellatus]